MSRSRDHRRMEYSSRDRDSSSQRSSGRSPTPTSKPRDINELPNEFGHVKEPTSKEDENTVLKRMKTAFKHSPLNTFNDCILQNKKIKIWTRNFEEIRGVCTGYVVAFDKHWNLVLSDVDEVYLKPKKAKTPYLLDEDLPELPPKVPKKKKEKTPEEEEAAKKAEEEAAAAKSAEEEGAATVSKKKPKKKKKKCREYCQRNIKQLFIRGDSIVMCAVLH